MKFCLNVSNISPATASDKYYLKVVNRQNEMGDGRMGPAAETECALSKLAIANSGREISGVSGGNPSKNAQTPRARRRDPRRVSTISQPPLSPLSKQGFLSFLRP